MGPFLVVLMGISLVTVPEAARMLRRSPRHLLLYCMVLSAVLAIAAMAWGGVLLLALPTRARRSSSCTTGGGPTISCCSPRSASLAACVIAGASAETAGTGGVPAQPAVADRDIGRLSHRAVCSAPTSTALSGPSTAWRSTVWIGAGVWWWQLHRWRAEGSVERSC